MPDNTLLCGIRGRRGAVTVKQYKAWALLPDHGWSTKKPGFIQRRLQERYIAPLKKMKRKDKNGFMTLSVSCLLIETLEAFYRGMPDTRNKSKETFLHFFQHRGRFKRIQEAGLALSFYEDVRCGILHQGETRNGWTVRRRGPLFVDRSGCNGPILNATKFHDEVSRQVRDYARALRRDAKLRSNFEIKMKRVLENCK